MQQPATDPPSPTPTPTPTPPASGTAVGTWGTDGPGLPMLTLTEDGRLAGTDGCNRLFGSWSQKDELVEFTGVGSTMMACDGVDTWLVFLHTGQVHGDVLHISNTEGDEIGTLDRTA